METPEQVLHESPHDASDDDRFPGVDHLGPSLTSGQHTRRAARRRLGRVRNVCQQAARAASWPPTTGDGSAGAGVDLLLVCYRR